MSVPYVKWGKLRYVRLILLFNMVSREKKVEGRWLSDEKGGYKRRG